MSYLGNTPTQQAFIPAIDFFSGNGSTVAFTLSRPVASVAQVQVTIENVPQNPGDAFTVSNNTITFTSAPPSGTNNIYVYYTSPITQVIQPGQGTVGTAQLQSGVLTPAAVSDQNNTSTGYFDLPAGTTAERPGSPNNGMARYNTTITKFEFYQNGEWISYVLSYDAEFLIVAGGGGGASGWGGIGGGGGGAGGYISSTLTTTSGASYSVTVGAGGIGQLNLAGTSGSNSSFNGLTAIGGGYSNIYNGGNAASGGSGGGGTFNSSAAASGTVGQGNAGGAGSAVAYAYGGGGGGGAGAVGAAGSGSVGGAGGVGLNWQSVGTFYAGGGGGGAFNGTGGAGGTGGGGAGASGASSTVNGNAGTANTGGGGGGGSSNGSTGGAGGSGVVVIRYLGTQKGSGGTVTSSGGYTYHTFTTSGTYIA